MQDVSIWNFAVYPPERKLLYRQIAVCLPIWDRYTATYLFISPVLGDEQQSAVQSTVRPLYLIVWGVAENCLLAKSIF